MSSSLSRTMHTRQARSILCSFITQKANISIATVTRRKSLTCDQGCCWLPPLTFKYWYNISGELLSCLKSDSSWKELAGTGGRTAVANWSGVCSTFTEAFSLKDWPRSRFKSACGLEYYRALGNQLKQQQPKSKKGKSNRKLLTSDFANIVFPICILTMFNSFNLRVYTQHVSLQCVCVHPYKSSHSGYTMAVINC